MKEISIIIPIYNTEKYIKECIDSIRKQSIKNIEIICIDDGSTDDSVEIIKEYKSIDPRVSLYQQSHKGVSSARNLGLKYATGEYVIFIDSDDYLIENRLGAIYKTAKQCDADILVFSGRTTNRFLADEWIFNCFSVRECFYERYDSDIIFSEDGVFPMVWNKMFRTVFLKSSGVLFDERLKIAEDHLFDLMIFPKAQRVKFTSQKVYIYRVARQDSAMQKRQNDKGYFHVKFAEIIYDNWEQQSKTDRERLANYLLDFLYSTLLEMPYFCEIAKSLLPLSERIKRDRLQISPRSLEIKKYFKKAAVNEEIISGEFPLLFPSAGEKLKKSAISYGRYIKRYGIIKGIDKMFRRILRLFMRSLKYFGK